MSAWSSLVVLIATLATSLSALAGWQPYGERYAIIVMGGDVSDPHYTWYWNDTYGMYNLLKSHGFTDANIYFLSYGQGGGQPPDPTVVDATSTTANITAAYQWAEQICTNADLLYIFWVDHGSPTGFETHDGTITHGTLATLMAPIVAQQIIGAYNPCYSGAVIDDISAMGVVTVTSQDATHPNSWGWAGKWREALAGGTPGDPSDTDTDGYVSITEAYEWIAPKSQGAGEHSMMDDNGDGVGSEWGDPSFNPSDPTQDGHAGTFCSLHGVSRWLVATNGIDYSYADGDVAPLDSDPTQVRLSHWDNPGTVWYSIDIGTSCVQEGMVVGIYFCDWGWPGDGPSLYIQNKDTYEYELIRDSCGDNDQREWEWVAIPNSNDYVWADGHVWLKVYAEGWDDTVVDKVGVIFEQCQGPSAPNLSTPSSGGNLCRV